MKKGYVVNRIDPIYKGCHAIVAAPGPSLTPEVVEKLREVKDRYLIVGVGDTYRCIDFLDEHYACDARWWKVHGPKILNLSYKFSSWCYDDEGMQYGAKKIEGKGDKGFSKDRRLIHFGQNSGFQALNLCYLWGISRMILVGFNMQKVENKSHFFGNEREGNLAINSPYNRFAQNFFDIEHGIKKTIVNCTTDSALTAFRVEDLDEELRKRK